MDIITLLDIKFTTLIGIHDWEKTTPQHLHLDLQYNVDVKKIAEKDNIEATIDYEKVLNAILKYTKDNQFQLIETLAEKLANMLFEQFAINWLTLTLHKPKALLNAKDVFITIERKRP